MPCAKHACVVLLFFASACGGGGSGGEASSSAPFPNLSEDVAPAGQRIDVTGRDYFALAAGGAWGYERTSDGLPPRQHNREVRTNGPAESPIFLIDDTADSFYRSTPDGLVSVNPLRAIQADFPAVAAALPSLLEFPTPFYPVGGVRRLVRQGDMQADLDGDGINERYRIEFTQVFLGFEPMLVMDVVTEVARFRSTFTFSIYSTRDKREVTSTSVEESAWSDGLGLVQARRSVSASDGVPTAPAYNLRLTDAVVGGMHLGPGAASPSPIPLTRRDVVYDASRAVYYATVGATDGVNRNRLAVIDAVSGLMSFTRELGPSPGTLALTVDSSVLYVGLQGSGEILKLALPSMQELARFRLPVEPFRGTQFLPEDVAVSPTDHDLIAVSMYRPGTQLKRHAGILMARSMVALPKRTPAWEDGNLLAFGPDGTTLHSLNNEFPGILGPVRQFTAGPEGPVQLGAIGLFTGYPFEHPELNVVDDLMTIQNNVWTASSTPEFVGGVVDLHCSKLPGVPKVACLRPPMNTLAVYSLPSLQPLGTVAYAAGERSTPWRLVPGLAGQVAIVNDSQIVLFSDPLLQ